MNTPARRIRFLTHINDSVVKITLAPGQTLRHFQGGPTDEGWTSSAESWTYDGAGVTRETLDRGRDCDGLHEHGGTSYAPTAFLTARCDEWTDGHRMPEWSHVDAYQRDHAAEAANY